MKRSLILTFILIMVLSAASMATDTRVLTMGMNNNILLDEANIGLYPSRLYDYPNLAIAEFGTFDQNNYSFGSMGYYSPYYYWDKAIQRYDFFRFGINWKFGEDDPWVVGTTFEVLPPMYPTDYFGSSLVGWDMGLMENRRITLGVAKEVGSNNLGFSFGLVNSGYKSDYTDNTDEEGFTVMQFGLGLTPNSGQWDVGLHFHTGSWTDKAPDGTDDTEADGYYDFILMGRLFHNYSPVITFVPHASVAMGKHGAKYNYFNGDNADLDATAENKVTGFQVGSGMNYTPASNVLAVLDFGFEFVTIKETWDYSTPYVGTAYSEEYKEGHTLLPYFRIGLDADVFKWLDIRMGATANWHSIKEEYSNTIAGSIPTKETWSYASNDSYLGFGFHFGRLHVDTYTDPELFLNGFDFISGNSTSEMNVKISAVYEMM